MSLDPTVGAAQSGAPAPAPASTAAPASSISAADGAAISAAIAAGQIKPQDVTPQGTQALSLHQTMQDGAVIDSAINSGKMKFSDITSRGSDALTAYRAANMPAPGSLVTFDDGSGVGERTLPLLRAGSKGISWVVGDTDNQQGVGVNLVSKIAPPPTSLANDLTKSTGQGMLNAAADIAGTPADLYHMVTEKLPAWAIGHLATAVGAISPDDLAKINAVGDDGNPQPGTSDYFKNLIQSNLVNQPAYQPQTTPGKYAQTISEFAGNAATGGPRAALTLGAIPGAVSETAGELTQGTPIEPYARLGGAIIGSGPAMAASLRSAPSAIIGKAVDGVSSADLDQAQALMAQAKSIGTPITLAEAVQHVTNGASGLGDLQRVLERSGPGGAVLRDTFSGRPDANEAAFGDAAAGISPPIANPEEIAPRVQAAALGSDAAAPADTVRGAEQARTAATSPYYVAAAKDRVPPEHIEALLQKLDAAIDADKTGILSGPLSEVRHMLTERPAVPGTPAKPGRYVSGQYQPGTPAVAAQARVPVTDIENLDRARKYLRDKIDLPDFAAEATPKEAAKNIRAALADLKQSMQAASDNFRKGVEEHARISRETVEPIYRSATGQLAAAEKFPDQAKIIFDQNPMPGSERGIAQAIATVSKSDPDAARALVRGKLEQVFNEATQRLQGGQNQWGGAKYAAILFGNRQQALNLEAAARALPNGDAAWSGFRRMLDVFEAQGTRQMPGSQTAFNAVINEHLKRGGLLGEAITTAASPEKWWTAAKDAYRAFRMGQNTRELAQLLVSPEAVPALRKLARLPVDDTAARALSSVLMNSIQAAKTPDERKPAPKQLN